MAKSKRLTTKQKNIVIKALAEGATQRDAAKRAGISQATLSTNKPLLIRASQTKKEIEQKFDSETKNELGQLAKDLLSVTKDSVKILLNSDKLKKGSAPQIAMVMGTAFDKMQLLTGGATENVNLTTGEKDKLIDFISKSESANYSSKKAMASSEVIKKQEKP